MANLFDHFQPLDQGSRQTLIEYSKVACVNDVAQCLTKDEYKNKLPQADHANFRDKDSALQWLRNLIPNQANVAGDWKLYFVANYANTWITARYPGNSQASLLAREVLDQVRAARRLDTAGYYDEIRLITVDGTSPFKTEYDAHVKKQWAGIKQVGWRGDDRNPTMIMQTGFSPKVSVNVPIWRPQDHNLDVDLDTTVCVARDIRGTAFFPLSKPVQYTWAYCVLIREGWNTYYLQKKLATEANLSRGDAGYSDKVWLFHEQCVNRVDPHDIVLAIQVERRIRDGRNPLSGIQFRLLTNNGRKNFMTWPKLEQDQRKKIEDTVSQFGDGWYPAAGQWLTYQGIVGEKEQPEWRGPNVKDRVRSFQGAT